MSQGLVYLNQGCLRVECFVTFLPGRESPSTLGTDLDSSLLPAFLPLPLSGEFYWWYCSHVFLLFSLILFSLKVLYSGIFLRTQNYSFIYFLKTEVVIVLLPKIFPFPWWPAFLYFDSWGSRVPLSPEVLLMSLHVVPSKSLLLLQGCFTLSFSWSLCLVFWAFFSTILGGGQGLEMRP